MASPLLCIAMYYTLAAWDKLNTPTSQAIKDNFHILCKVLHAHTPYNKLMIGPSRLPAQ